MIHLNAIEPYDPKKYRDDFGKKINPFKYVALVTAYLPNGSSIELVLKFIRYPEEKQIEEKSEIMLRKVGLII